MAAPADHFLKCVIYCSKFPTTSKFKMHNRNCLNVYLFRPVIIKVPNDCKKVKINSNWLIRIMYFSHDKKIVSDLYLLVNVTCIILHQSLLSTCKDQILPSSLETYLGPNQTSKMGLSCENDKQILAVNYLRKKFSSQMFHRTHTSND